jgi:serine phosphatase RsbU (regulator of sigma subunit)
LPQTRPDVPGYGFFDYYASAEEVGGDYYGYVPLSDGRLAITLGDVSGKGISAALVMARLCSEVRYLLGTSDSPEQAVNQLNREFAKPENEAWFVTFVLCVLDPRKHSMKLINAGHIAPLRRIAESGVLESLGEEITGPPLGCDPNSHYTHCDVRFAPGDLLVMHTDGISEAMDSQRTLFGEERVRQAVRSGPERVEPLCEDLLHQVQTFRGAGGQADDICLIGLQREL